LFIRKNLLPEKLPEEVLPVTSPEEGSYDRINCYIGRTFFQKKELFFNTRAILSIHLIAGYTSNVIGCT